MSVCPITTSEEWEALEAAHGVDGAWKRWLQNGKEIPGVSNFTMGKNSVLFRELQKNVDGNVSINADMDVLARIVKTKEKDIIEVNPNLLQSNNEIHEFGQVYVDLLGGLDNPIMKAGLARLRGSDLEKQLKDSSGIVNGQEFKKELLAVAITKDGSDIWKSNPENAKSISTWSTAFFKNLNKAIGINANIAKDLAKDPLKEIVAKKRIEEGSIEEQLYGKFANKPKTRTASEKQKRLAKQALGIITSKVEMLKKRKDDSNRGQALALAELIELQKDLQTARADLALAEFVSLAQRQTDVILSKFKDYKEGSEDPSLRGIQYLDTATRAFDSDLLDAISNDLTDDQSELQDQLDKIFINKDKINKSYKKIANDLLKNTFGEGLFKKLDGIFAREAEIEFQKRDREKESPEKKERRKAYIEQYKLDNAERIANRKEEKLDTFLTDIEKDISLWDSFVNNAKDMNSSIIRQTVKMFDEHDFRVQEKSVFIARKAEDHYKKYQGYVGKNSNQKEFYAPILEKTAEGTVIPRLAQRGSPEWADIKSTGGKYKGTPVEEMYDFLVELSVDTDNLLPARSRLKMQLPVMNKNGFERLASGNIFNAIKEGIIDQFTLRADDTESGQILDDSEEKKEEDIRSSMDDTVKVLSTQAGEEKKIIPIHFRGKIKEKDRSYDVMSLMVIDAHQAIDYASKVDLAATVEITLSLVKDAQVTQRSGFLGRVKANSDDSAQKEKGQSNVYKALERVIENRLYGIQTTGDAKTAKITSTIKSYVSIINLFGNYLSAGANFTQGLAMTFMEGAGGQFYGIKNVFKAEAKYTLDTASNVADISRHRAKGKTNLLRELFNAQSNWTVLENEFNVNNGLKRNANLGTGLALNSGAEHMVQSIGMYAVLDNIKVKNKDGNYITKEGKVTEDREKAMSIDEAYEVGYQNTNTQKTISRKAYDKLSEIQKKDYMDGVLHLDEKVASTDRTQDKGTFEISQVLRRVNRDLFGNYDPKNKSRAEAHAIGSLFTHMRQWMVPGTKKRFKGGHALYIRDKKATLGYRTLKNSELRDVDLDYNVETEAFEEGMYISTLRFVSVMVKDLKALKFKVMSETWKDLTEMEKSNVKRTASEIAMSAAAYLTWILLAGALEADDDEGREHSHGTLVAAYYTRRLLSELMTYTNPIEWTKTFRSPAVTLSLIENTIKALIQSSPSYIDEVYEKGDKKGESKFVHAWMKVTPLKIFDKDVENSLKWIVKGY